MPERTSTIDLSIRDMLELETERSERASVIVYGPDGVEVAHLSSPHDTVVVGRVHPSDICINDPSLSRQHARFRWENETLTVTDLKSHNGTWIRRERVESASLLSGEVVQLGNVKAMVAIKVADVRPATPPSVTIPGAEGMVVLNPKMRDLYEQVRQAASHDASVLVLGETGTGKEHVAGAIHALGTRSQRPFVTINCAAIPRELLESQLFGHEKGAFTGAVSTKPGLFEQAHTGVLFLDEIGELSLSAQAALLRAVETKKVTRVGSAREIGVDVRIVTATHCSVEAMVREGTFRQDLLYRLNAITFELPPLRERIDEIEPLAELFLKQACEAWGQSPKRLHPAVLDKLRKYEWPGNIRQLRNIIERCVLSARKETIEVGDLPSFIDQPDMSKMTPLPPMALSAFSLDTPDLSYKERLQRLESALISEAMHRTDGSQRAAARLLRMPRRTLASKLETLGLADRRWGREAT